MTLFSKIYKQVKQIPEGKVATYGQVARKIQNSKFKMQNDNLKFKVSPRTVGWALHANKDKNIPCHRVVNKEGRLAPNFARLQRIERSDFGQAFDGWREQKRRLESEGVKFKSEMYVDLDRHQWMPN